MLDPRATLSRRIDSSIMESGDHPCRNARNLGGNLDRERWALWHQEAIGERKLREVDTRMSSTSARLRALLEMGAQAAILDHGHKGLTPGSCPGLTNNFPR